MAVVLPPQGHKAFPPSALASFAVRRLAEDVRHGEVSAWSVLAWPGASAAGLEDELRRLREEIAATLAATPGGDGLNRRAWGVRATAARLGERFHSHSCLQSLKEIGLDELAAASISEMAPGMGPPLMSPAQMKGTKAAVVDAGGSDRGDVPLHLALSDLVQVLIDPGSAAVARALPRWCSVALPPQPSAPVAVAALAAEPAFGKVSGALGPEIPEIERAVVAYCSALTSCLSSASSGHLSLPQRAIVTLMPPHLQETAAEIASQLVCLRQAPLSVRRCAEVAESPRPSVLQVDVTGAAGAEIAALLARLAAQAEAAGVPSSADNDAMVAVANALVAVEQYAAESGTAGLSMRRCTASSAGRPGKLAWTEHRRESKWGAEARAPRLLGSAPQAPTGLTQKVTASRRELHAVAKKAAQPVRRTASMPGIRNVQEASEGRCGKAPAVVTAKDAELSTLLSRLPAQVNAAGMPAVNDQMAGGAYSSTMVAVAAATAAVERVVSRGKQGAIQEPSAQPSLTASAGSSASTGSGDEDSLALSASTGSGDEDALTLSTVSDSWSQATPVAPAALSPLTRPLPRLPRLPLPPPTEAATLAAAEEPSPISAFWGRITAASSGHFCRHRRQ